MPDVFSQLASLRVTESAANTLTYSIFQASQANLFTRQAMIIHRLEYNPTSGSLTELSTEADRIEYGLSTQDGLNDLDLDQVAIVDYNKYNLRQVNPAGANTNSIYSMWPYVKDYNDLPGGGIILPFFPLYLFLRGTGLANPTTVKCRLRYTLRELKPDEYIELVEAARILV